MGCNILQLRGVQPLSSPTVIGKTGMRWFTLDVTRAVVTQPSRRDPLACLQLFTLVAPKGAPLLSDPRCWRRAARPTAVALLAMVAPCTHHQT
jgi:hypothetical protein